MLAVLRVTSTGRVIAANGAAREWLGEVVGQRCCDVVLGRAGRRLRCEPGCSERLVADGEGRDDVLTVRGGRCAVTCERVGSEVVVLLRPGAPGTDQAPILTQRERESLIWVAAGAETPEIALRMGVLESTVRTHIEHAREKLGARTRAEAVARALQRGEITPGAEASSDER